MPDDFGAIPTPNVRVIYGFKLGALAFGTVVALVVKALALPDFPFALFAGATLLTALAMLAVIGRSAAPSRGALAGSFVAEALFITTCIHAGGGVEMISGPMLYLAVIILAGLLYSEYAAIVAVAGCVLSYAGVLWAEQHGWLPSYVPFKRGPERQVLAVINVAGALSLAAAAILYAAYRMRGAFREVTELRGNAVRHLAQALEAPLSRIDALSQQVATAAPDDRRRILHEVRAIAEHAIGLVGDVLNKARSVDPDPHHAQQLPFAGVRRIYAAKAAAMAVLIGIGWVWEAIIATGEQPIGGQIVLWAPGLLATATLGPPVLLNLAIALRPRRPPAALLGLTVAAELIGLTVGIFNAGGVEMVSGPVAYIVLITIAGLSISERAAVLAAIGAIAAYGAMAWVESLGVLPRPVPFLREPARIAVAVSMVGLCLSIVTWLVLYAVRQIRAIHARADGMRAEVVSTLSHDLKNPLGIILGYAEIGMDCRELDLHPFVASLQHSAQQALILVRNVLDAADLDGHSREPTRQAVDIDEVIAEVLRLYRLSADERGLEFSVVADGALRPVVADRQMLLRALGNLVSNAIKYTPAGGRVRLIRDGTGDGCRITVEDNGPGIPAHEQERLFQRYYRASTGRGIEGTGLGLFIVRRIADAHGGRVWFHSVVGQGSRFTMELPYGEGAE